MESLMRVIRTTLMTSMLGFAACTGIDPLEPDASATEDLLTGQQVQAVSTEPASKFIRNARPVPQRYIVVLKDEAPGANGMSVPGAASALASRYGGVVAHVYEHALRGFSVRMPEARARALSEDPAVKYVEEDGEVGLVATQFNPPWGLDRVDQRHLPLSGSYTYNHTGANVNVYILDTGIRTTHAEFGGRAYGAYTAIADTYGTSDCNGHGTHVAATVAGTTYGVAKSARVYSVRVLDCWGNGTWSGVIAGINWVRQYHVKPAVANMSLGGGASQSVDDAVRNAINAGITFSIAAGNSNDNACNYSPARVAQALTVAASTSADARASYSNWGSCVNLFAPGSSVLSAYHTHDTASTTMSGTSMAAPHVAGAAALYLQQYPAASPSTVHSAIINRATYGKISDPRGTPNRLLAIPEPCGNQICHSLEDSYSCPQDCGDVCGNYYCGPNETVWSCPQDCGYCGDGYCGPNEDSWSCPSDCGGFCGDGCCAPNEDAWSCPSDCSPGGPIGLCPVY
jgi:subtilisin family serine protease